MTKKKILIVNDLLKGGGVEKLMLDLTLAWHDKYDITIRTDDYDDSFEEIYPADVTYITENSNRLLSENVPFASLVNTIIKRIHRKWHNVYIARQHYDVAIAIKEGWKIKDVARFQNVKKRLAWVHTDYNNYYYTKWIFGSAKAEQQIMQQFDNIVCVSEDIMESIKNVIGDPGNLIVRYNPVDVTPILEKSKEIVVDLEEKRQDYIRFVSVGRLNYQKGFDLLLEACNMLNKDGKKYEVVIVGDRENFGEEHNRLYRTKERLRLDNVFFVGGRKNPYKYIANSDWFISSSIFEGFSYVSQEAALLDVPMILTSCSGVRELLGDNEYGIVVEPSVYGLYHGMKKILENPQLHAEYKKKIFERKKIITYKDRIDFIEELL